DDFEDISFDQATNVVRRHVGRNVTLVTPAVPGVSVQMSGTLYVQEGGDHFAFAVAAGEHLSASVLPFQHCHHQIPTREGAVEALVCAMPGDEGSGDVLLWMLRFE